MNQTRSFAAIAYKTADTIEWLHDVFGLPVVQDSPLMKILAWINRELNLCLPTNAAASGTLTITQNRAIRGLEMLCIRLEYARRNHTMTEQFGSLIQNMAIGVPSLCSAYSDFFNPLDDENVHAKQASDKILELVVALTALQMGNKVTLESPGRKTKPDIKVEIDGVTWGFGCKVSSSQNPSQHFSILAKGAIKAKEQLDAGQIDQAIQVLSVQNVFTRGGLTLPDLRAAQNSLKTRAQHFRETVMEYIPAQRIKDELLDVDDRLLPGVIVYFEDVVETGCVDLVIRPGRELGHLTYMPLSYAQYVTFGDHGLELSDVPHQLAMALTGPNTEEVGSMYDLL